VFLGVVGVSGGATQALLSSSSADHRLAAMGAPVCDPSRRLRHRELLGSERRLALERNREVADWEHVSDRPPRHVYASPHGCASRCALQRAPRMPQAEERRRMRIAIVGGGILGLAAGRLLVRERSDVDVVLFEKEASLAQHQTGRNSGVVHAGLYYEPGSLKARLCRRGGDLLRAFCLEHELPYDECGKVLVATREDELPRLERVFERAQANGVTEARLIDSTELHALEPHAAGLAALHSPTTAIVDYSMICRELAAEMRDHGALIRTSASVRRVAWDGDHPRVELDDDSSLRTDRLLVCAGLHVDRLARASGEPAEPRIVPFRGEYFRLRPHRSNLVRGLVYPVPDPTLPFLGVHLTRTVDGSVLVGPNAVLAYAREGYRKRDVSAADLWDTVSWPGMWRVARRHWGSGAREVVRSLSKRAFVREARRYVPELRAEDVVPAPAGVRAQAIDRDGALVDDFRLDVGRNAVWVRNAPSPAATSSLAIAEELVSYLGL